MNQNDSKHVLGCAQIHQPGADCTCPRTKGIWCAFPNPGKDAITIATHIASSDGMLSEEIETLIAVAPNTGPSRANVRLMIAAPALLEALREIVINSEPSAGTSLYVADTLIEAAQKVVKQATGETVRSYVEDEIDNEKGLAREARAIAEERHAEELQRHDAWRDA